MNRKRLVICVEGKGDVQSVPKLAARMLADIGGEDILFVHPDPFRVTGIGKLVRNDHAEWKRWLFAIQRTRPATVGVLLVLDGDLKHVPTGWTSYVNRFGTAEFCPYRVAAVLADVARAARAGETFSVAVVFAMQEFEAWLLAGIEGLRGVKLAESRGAVSNDIQIQPEDVESHRDAKGLLRSKIPEYQQTLDQALFAGKLDLQMAGNRSRSFRRLKSAIRQLAAAARTGHFIVTPQLPHS